MFCFLFVCNIYSGDHPEHVGHTEVVESGFHSQASGTLCFGNGDRYIFNCGTALRLRPLAWVHVAGWNQDFRKKLVAYVVL